MGISNKTYDLLKVLVTIVLPAVDTLYITLANIWGLGFGGEVDASVQAIIAFLNTLLGVFVVTSSKSYAKKSTAKKAKKGGAKK